MYYHQPKWVPQICLLFNGHKGATPLVAQRLVLYISIGKTALRSELYKHIMFKIIKTLSTFYKISDMPWFENSNMATAKLLGLTDG